MGFLIQTAASAAAVGVLIAFAAWARIARPTPPLDEARARALMAEEFPGRALDGLWLADDGRGAIARSGALALVLRQVGDGYVARHVAWTKVQSARSGAGMLSLDLGDIAAPRARLAFQAWPPGDVAGC